MIFFMLVLAPFSNEKNLLQLKKEYLMALKLEPEHIDKGEAYINLSLIDIRCRNYKEALKEAKLADYYGRKKESIFLEGIIHYQKGNKARAIDFFKKLDEWQYAVFLKELYEVQLSEKEITEFPAALPDTLEFYFLFYMKDSVKIRKKIAGLKLKEWQYKLGKGYMAYKNENYRKALSFFKESWNLKPDNNTGVCIMASYFNLEMPDSLLKFQLDKGIGSSLATYLRAEALYRKDSIKTAVSLFLSDTASEYRLHSLYGAGWGKYRLEDYSTSVKLFDMFLNEYSGGRLEQYAKYRLARGLLKQGKVKSLKYFEEIVNKFPDSPLVDDSYLLLGKIHLLLEHYEESKKWFNRLIKQFPESRWAPYTYRYLARIYTEEKEFSMALKSYNNILKNKYLPHQFLDEVKYRIEEIKWKMGEYPSRIVMFKNFISKYPDNTRTPSVLLRIGDYYKAAARYNKAEHYFKKILDNYPASDEYPLAIFKLENVYLSNGALEKAITLLKDNLKFNPDLSDRINKELGDIYYRQDQLEKAIFHYGMVKSRGYIPYTQYRLGKIYFEIGLFREARVPLKNLIDNYEDSQFFTESYLLLARTYLREGSLEEAIYTIDKGFKKASDKERTAFLLLKADILCQMNDEKAIDIYKKAAETTGININETIDILKNALECAVQMNLENEVELLKQHIEVLQTHKEE